MYKLSRLGDNQMMDAIFDTRVYLSGGGGDSQNSVKARPR